MTTAIGVVMTGHIVTGRLEDQRLTGKLLRYPEDPELMNELDAIPGSELVEILAEHIRARCEALGSGAGKADAIGVAVPGIVRSGVIEESPNLKQLKGMRLAEELAECAGGARNHGAGTHGQRCGRHCRRRGRHARKAGQAYPGMDDRQRHRLWTLAVCGGGLGGWAHHRDARPQGALLRVRRRRPPRGHHGPPRHAHALSRPGAGRSLCQRQAG